MYLTFSLINPLSLSLVRLRDFLTLFFQFSNFFSETFPPFRNVVVYFVSFFRAKVVGLIAHVRDCNLRSFTVSFQTLLPLLRVLRDRTVPSEDSHRLLLAMKVMNSHMRLIRAGAPKIFHKDDASSGLPDHRHQACLKEKKTYHKKLVIFLQLTLHLFHMQKVFCFH